MNLRVLIAGLVGGVAMFTWAAIAHQATPLDAVGVSQIPNEEAVLTALQASIGPRAGLFLFPNEDEAGKASMAPARPSGVLIYRPPGMPAGVTPIRLLGEFVFELIEATIAAILLAQTRLTSYLGRAGFVALIGLAAVLTTNASNWDFYGYPADYTLAYGFMDFMRYVFAGLVMAALVRPRPSASALLAGSE